MVKWTKIKTVRGKKWHDEWYETNDRKAKHTYKVISTPTASCKKEWKKMGMTAKKTTKYTNTVF